jgi:hypothetical protein
MMAMRKNNADEKVAPDHDGERGRTAKPAKTDVKIIMGAILNNPESALAGVISSF